ncbi:MAG: M20/M25/M40 family metallo-hydrolase [Anaerolineales bacterium]|nr:M20/M25/M40 family metallo-hydrolase [Anaerolineales bacterium]
MKELESYLKQNLPVYMEYFRQMISINSFTGNPEGVNQLGALTADIFAPLGFQADFVQSADPAYGKHLFLARPPFTSSAKTIAMISHLDTVFPPQEELDNDFYWRIEGDRIYGPGTVDIKGGTLMMYMILDALNSLHPDFYNSVDWLLALDASEEALSDDFGTTCLQRLPQSTAACLVFEGGTQVENSFPIVVARKGRATFKVEVKGRSAHAGNNHALGANAIHQLAHSILKIEALTDYTNDLTFNVGVISGGTVVNRVPHYAEAVVEMRAFSKQVFQNGYDRMLALADDIQVMSTDGFTCTVSIQPVYQTGPWPRNAETDRLFSLWESAARRANLHIQKEERGGLSDGNLLCQHFPTLDGLGPTGANAHCSEKSSDGTKDQEYALASSFVPKAILNTLAILSL